MPHDDLPPILRRRRRPNHPNGASSIAMVHGDTREPGTPPEQWHGMSEADQLAWKAKHFTPDEWAQARDHLRKATMILHLNFPFFGSILTSVAEKQIWIKTEADRLKVGADWRTMATDSRWLYIWPQFALYHTPFELTGVLLHEIYHNMFGHLERGLGYHPGLSNIAKDHAINLMINDLARTMYGRDPQSNPVADSRLEEYPFIIPEWDISLSLTDPTDMTEKVSYCVNNKYRDDLYHPWLWEKIHRDLEDELGEEWKAAGCPMDGLGDLVDGHGVWAIGDRPADDEGNVNTDPYDARRIKEAIQDAKVRVGSEQWGKLPGGLRRFVDDMLNPPLPWYRMLSKYMKLVPYDVHYVPGDMRFNEPMIAMYERPELSYAVFGFDVSGSMGPREIAECIGNARAILRSYPRMRGLAMFWDGDVSDIIPIEKFDATVSTQGFMGGGGTTPQPLFDKIKEKGIEKDVAVVVNFTDGFFHWGCLRPDEIPYDVMWVITNDHLTEEQRINHHRYRYTRIDVGRD